MVSSNSFILMNILLPFEKKDQLKTFLHLVLNQMIVTASSDSSYCLKLQADVDNSGTIDYGEFIAATLHFNKIEREDHLFAAFSYFDKDGSGYITADELQQACEEFGIGDVHLEDMIRDADQDNVSSISTLL